MSGALAMQNKNVTKVRRMRCRSPLIQIQGGTFYRHPPHTEHVTHNAKFALFPNLNFSIPSSTSSLERWAIIGPASAGKTTFLEILRCHHLCVPPKARVYPYLSSEHIITKDPRLRDPRRAIQYVGFSSEQRGSGQVGVKGSYLSARYESRREETDFTLLDYLKGNTDLNDRIAPAPSPAPPPAKHLAATESNQHVWEVMKDLNLLNLSDIALSNLSNGQTRRAMIAKALLAKPELLLLDEPFMGLDPATTGILSQLLKDLADRHSPRVVLALRPQDPVPDWITHVVYLRPSSKVQFHGEKGLVLEKVTSSSPGGSNSIKLAPRQENNPVPPLEDYKEGDSDRTFHKSQILRQQGQVVVRLNHGRELLIRMNGARVSYGPKTVLGGWKQCVDGEEREGLWWQVARGESWGIFGPNGSGKTTILSLICSDHPQTYSLPIELFGQSRLPKPGQPGISIFDLQARIGHSSPEIHAFFPRNLSLSRTLESAWADTFIGKPKIGPKGNAAVRAALEAFRSELNLRSSPSKGEHWAEGLLFGDLPFSAQRIALFLRAIVKRPDVIILDEAFSGMDEALRDKCMMHLQGWLTEDQALICVSHLKEEVPLSVRQWMCLSDSPGMPPRFGTLDSPIRTEAQWNRIWGIS